MKSWFLTLILAAVSVSLSGCIEDIPEVECNWVLPGPETQKVPSSAGFNLRVQVRGAFTAEQLPAVRFFSDLEQDGASHPDGMLLESGIAIDESLGCENGCLAGGRFESTIRPGNHQLVARALTPRGNTACEATLDLLVNSPPQVTAVILNPEAPATGDDVEFIAEVSDPDGDDFQVSNSWVGPEPMEPLLGDTLTPIHTQLDQLWQLQVSADDGFDRGAPFTLDFAIANTPPAAPTVHIEPDPARLDSKLRCSVDDPQGLDPDDQQLEVLWAWTVDGSDAGISDAEVAGSLTSAAEQWTCTARISDGIASSAESSASTTVLAELSFNSPTAASNLPRIAGSGPEQRIGDLGGLGSPGDINGDGLSDLILTMNGEVCPSATPFDCTGQAHAYLFAGSSAGLPDSVNGHNTDFRPAPGLRIQAPARVGDLNGDGIDELVMAYRTANPLTTLGGEIETWTQASGISGLYLVFGNANGHGAVFDLEADAVKITATAESSGNLLSPSPCPIGDLDNDGFDDLAITAPGDDQSRGSLFVIYGHPGAWLSGLSPGTLQPGFRLRGGPQNLDPGERGDALGMSCAGRVDLNNDGLADLVVGAPRGGAEGNGWVLIFHGDGTRWGPEITSSMADVIISGDSIESTDPSLQNTRFGQAISALHDFDGDGVDDLAISGMGPLSLQTVTVGDDDDSAAGDDDDSASETLVEQDAGTVWIASGGSDNLSGSLMAADLPYRITGLGDLGFCGLPHSVDINGDGIDDLVCADTRGDSIVQVTPAGSPAVRLFMGSAATMASERSYDEAELLLLAAGPDHQFGASLARTTDLDGDLYAELLIGAPGLDAPSIDSGAAYQVNLAP